MAAESTSWEGEAPVPFAERKDPFAELKDKIERAARLIAELREANYSLSAELVALQRKVDDLEADRSAPAGAPGPASEQSLSEELQLLRDERKIVRARVQNLLERIDKIEL